MTGTRAAPPGPPPVPDTGGQGAQRQQTPGRRQRVFTSLGRACIRFLRAAPAWLAYGLADAAVPLVVAGIQLERGLARPRTRGLHRNRRIVFRDRLTARSGRRLLWSWARHMCWLVIDICRMSRIDATNVDEYVEYGDLRPIRELLAQGRGVLSVTGHLGVFELCGHLAGLQDFPLASVFRPVPCAAAQTILRDLRAQTGQQVHSKWGVVAGLLRALQQGQIVGIAADENTKHRPVFAPFLGTLAATTRTPGILHLRTGAPIAVLSCQRAGRERYRFRLWDVIEHAPTGNEEVDLQVITERMNAALTCAILQDPAQWFWSARRWRTRPAGETREANGLPPPIAPGTPGSLTEDSRTAALLRLDS